MLSQKEQILFDSIINNHGLLELFDTEDLDPKDLIPTEGVVLCPAVVGEYVDAGECEPITVAKRDGKYLVIDGHHRAEAAKIEGRLIAANVINLPSHEVGLTEFCELVGAEPDSVLACLHPTSSPQFDHKHIPNAFEAAADLADHKHVREPQLAYFEPVIKAASQPNVTLEAVEKNNEYILQAVKTTSKFGVQKKEVLESTEPLNEEEFGEVIENIASMMDDLVIPEHTWFMENRPSNGIDM